MGAGRVVTGIANKASVLGLLLAGCLGGQTGQPSSASGECPKDSTPASDTLARFEGSYESPVALPGNGASCPAEADAVLRVEIESELNEREVLERECGAAWLPVSVELATDDGELATTESGWLSVGEDGVGGVRIDEPTWGGGLVTLRLDAEQRSVSSSTHLDNYRTFDACCLEAPSQSFAEFTRIDELGLIELVPGAPDVVGQEQVELELRVTAAPLANSCFESSAVNQAVSFELLDAEGVVVASGMGEAQGDPCERGEGCVFVELHADGQVSNPAYLGAAQPLKGAASRVFLSAEFDSCGSPALVAFAISVDVELEEYSIELSLNPAPSASVVPPNRAARASCFCWPNDEGDPPEGCP